MGGRRKIVHPFSADIGLREGLFRGTPRSCLVVILWNNWEDRYQWYYNCGINGPNNTATREDEELGLSDGLMSGQK